MSQMVVRRINNLLIEKKMSLYKLEKESAILHGSLSSIMSGKTREVTMGMCILIAHGFGMSLQEFINDPLFAYENFAG